jgi:hypothetical protein
MPVTAKLSRAFYDKLGDDATNELVNWFNSVDLDYRTELRSLNELNFARFDAKVEQRFAEQDAKWEKRFVEQDAKMDKRFAQQDVKWEQRHSELETRLIRWMFAFWTTTMVTQAGLFLAVLRLK